MLIGPLREIPDVTRKSARSPTWDPDVAASQQLSACSGLQFENSLYSVMRPAIILLLLCSTSVFAQEAEVAKAVETLKQALLDGKKDALEKIVHDNLTYGHSGGLIEDKAAFVEALASGRSDFTSIDLTDQTIKVSGNAATVRHKLSGENISNGTPGKINLSVLLVFIKEKGEWKLLARQAVKI